MKYSLKNNITLKDFIWSKLSAGEYITDQMVYNFLGKMPNYYTIEVYKRAYINFNHAKNRFSDYENHPATTLYHYRRRYYLQNEELLGKNRSYIIPKSYWEYLKDKGIKEV